MPKPQYTQKFRDAWLKDPLLKEWLVKVSSTEGIQGKCKICSGLLSNRYADLKAHAESKKHRSRAANIEGRVIGGRIQAKIPFPAVNVNSSAYDEAKEAEAKIALYIAQHAAINNTDHLVDISKIAFKKCDAAVHLQMHRTKCSNIIKNLWSPHFIRELRQDIGNDNPFSLLLDESTDITVDKYLGCTIIYFSNKRKSIINSFLDLIELKACDAESIVSAILETLQKFNLNISNLEGIGTDNASVMIGINNGVYAKLKQYAPNLILIRCVCHSLQLAVSAATKECLPRNLEFLIRETYSWFQHSSLRQLTYKNLFNALNDGQDPFKITAVSATRWLSIESAVARIYEQWLELKTLFSIAKENEKCYTAQMLYEMYNDDVNYAYISFLKPILSEVQKVNKAFEGKNTDSPKLLDDLMLLLNELIKKVTAPNSRYKLFQDNIESYVVRDSYLGYLFETQLQNMKREGFTDEVNLRTRCINFLVKLIKEVTQRLPDNVDILKKISLFSVQNTLRVVKPDLIDILQHLNYKPDSIQAVKSQWENITLVKWAHTTNTVEFWIEVLSYQDSNGENPYEELAKFALSLLVLPHSNAEVERLFSQMNIIKSKLRNRMKLEMMISLLNIRSGLQRANKCCSTLDIPDEVTTKIKTMETYKLQNTEDADLDNELINILDM